LRISSKQKARLQQVSRDSLAKIDGPALILATAILLGTVVRLLPGILARFPLNDGGMFYVMIRDLGNNHYLLPSVTTYNFQNIPYAYPPLGFYLAAAFHDVLRIPIIDGLLWLPAIISILSIPAMYLVANAILHDRLKAAIAAAFYALTPGLTAGGYSWFIMGGGLTRALGLLFLLLAVYALFEVIQVGGTKWVILCVCFCSLAVLSHPEAGLYTLASCALIWVFHRQSPGLTPKVLLVALGTLALTSLWWLSVLARNGPAPFYSALHTGMYRASFLSALGKDIFEQSSVIPILPVLRVVGILWAVWTRRAFLLAWLVLPYFVAPRSASSIAYFSLNILIAIGLTEAMYYVITGSRQGNGAIADLRSLGAGRRIMATTFAILTYLLAESLLVSTPLANSSLRPGAIEAMNWTRVETDAGSTFLVLTGNAGSTVDPTEEWFPALAERRSQSTWQGLEWTLGPRFRARLADLIRLQTCRDPACIEQWSADSGLSFTDLFVQKSGALQPLLIALAGDAGYEVTYDSPEIAIYRRIHNP